MNFVVNCIGPNYCDHLCRELSRLFAKNATPVLPLLPLSEPIRGQTLFGRDLTKGVPVRAYFVNVVVYGIDPLSS